MKCIAVLYSACVCSLSCIPRVYFCYIHRRQYTALPKRPKYIKKTNFQVLSRSPESGSTNGIIPIRKHTVYQHFLEYEDPISDARRVIGDRVQPFGSSLSYFSPPSWSKRYIKWLTIFGEYFFHFKPFVFGPLVPYAHTLQ